MTSLTKNNIKFLKNSSWMLITSIMLGMILLAVGTALRFAFDEDQIGRLVIFASLSMVILFVVLLTIELKIKEKARVIYAKSKESGDSETIMTLNPLLFTVDDKERLESNNMTSDASADGSFDTD